MRFAISGRSHDCHILAVHRRAHWKLLFGIEFLEELGFEVPRRLRRNGCNKPLPKSGEYRFPLKLAVEEGTSDDKEDGDEGTRRACLLLDEDVLVLE